MDEYAAQLLATRPEIEEIIVFGSFEKGNYAPGSDLDIFLVLSHSDQRPRDRIPDLLPGGFPVSVDLFPYTREEIATWVSPGLLKVVRASQWRYRRR